MIRPLLLPFLTALLLIAAAASAEAACYAEYKAKQDGPLRLHYGVMELAGACPDRAGAEAQVAGRLRAGGWELLSVMSLAPNPPSAQARANAGAYYLRY